MEDNNQKCGDKPDKPQSILSSIDQNFQEELETYGRLVSAINQGIDRFKLSKPENSDELCAAGDLPKTSNEYAILLDRKIKMFSGLNHQLSIIQNRLEEIL